MATSTSIVPLIIDGKDVLLEQQNGDPSRSVFQGATPELAIQAVESSAAAFSPWSKTSPQERRELLLKVAQLIKARRQEIINTTQEEIHCSELWANAIIQTGVELVEETAALTTDAVAGSIPVTQGDSYGLVFKEPLGVILGIAPWNAPVMLGLRAVVAPVAAGNTAVFKGSELSPRSHYLLVSLFREAGFPPGVVNFVLHTPEDAASVYEAMINHPDVKKCNFTGSTQVGRVIASKAAYALKPVLLELGGKNFAIVLDDADLDVAARQIVDGAFLNNGQVCMSTDLVIVSESTGSALESKILALLRDIKTDHCLISLAAKEKIQRLVSDAETKGATVHTASTSSTSRSLPPTLITGLTQEMKFFATESFGPIVGMLTVKSEEDIPGVIKGVSYGLSSSIFTTNHYKALKLAGRVQAGAVHVNSMTIHDEATLPHGGRGDSGWGRFGARWGLDEFLQTKTVVLNP